MVSFFLILGCCDEETPAHSIYSIPIKPVSLHIILCTGMPLCHHAISLPSLTTMPACPKACHSMLILCVVCNFANELFFIYSSIILDDYTTQQLAGQLQLPGIHCWFCNYFLICKANRKSITTQIPLRSLYTRSRVYTKPHKHIEKDFFPSQEIYSYVHIY